MPQLTVFNPDKSCADVFLISDSLANQLSIITQSFQLEEFKLAFLKEMNSTDLFPQFLIELTDVIHLIEQLPNPDSLSICLSN